MTVTREELAAFADGELDAARAADVAAAVAADPSLQAEVDAHRALKARLGAHFTPIHDAPVPHRLSALLESHTDTIVSFAAARERRERARTLPRWTWFAGPALAASLALAILLPRGASDGYAQGPLAEALDGQLVAAQDTGAATRILLSFRDDAGGYCRAFAGTAQSGIACRDDEGWRLRYEGPGAPAEVGDYRMAGTPATKVLERAQAMASGPALDAEEERAARARGWR
jgi:hypothetical protein